MLADERLGALGITSLKSGGDIKVGLPLDV